MDDDAEFSEKTGRGGGAPTKWCIYEAYGAWVAENAYGLTVWGRSRREVELAIGVSR